MAGKVQNVIVIKVHTPQLCITGLVSCVYSVEKLNSVYLMADAGTLIVPDTPSTLSLIVDTLDMLYKRSNSTTKN